MNEHDTQLGPWEFLGLSYDPHVENCSIIMAQEGQRSIFHSSPN